MNITEFNYVTYFEMPQITSDAKCLLSKVLTREIYSKINPLQSSNEYTFSNLIMSGVSIPSLDLGVAVGDEESW